MEYEKLSTARNMRTSPSQTESAELHPLEALTQALPGCHMALEIPPPADSGPKDQSRRHSKDKALEALRNVCQQLCPWRQHGHPLQCGRKALLASESTFCLCWCVYVRS